MPILGFGSWQPDLVNYQGQTTQLAQNVVPRGDGYSPVKQFGAFSQPLALGNDTYTKILLHFDGTDASTTITDSNAGGSAHTWTAAGNAQIDTAQSKFGGASGLFDGTGDWVTTPDHADFSLGSGTFTIDFWFRVNAAGGSALNLAGQMDSMSTDGAWSMNRTSGNVIVASVSTDGSNYTVVTGTTQFTNAVNTGWHHAALVRTGNTLKLFIDGTQEGGDVSFSGTVFNSSSVLAVGAAGAITTSPWNGWIDEFRLSVGIARWTAAFNSPSRAYDAPANGTCRGYFQALLTDGTVAIFAATSNRLLKMNNTALDWEDVSKSNTTYSALPSTHHWQFAQFGSVVIAVQPNVAPQAFTLGSSTNFADLGGSPPQCAYVAVVNRFLVLTGHTSNPFRIQWSDLGGITTWSSGLAGSQDFPNGGIVRGVAGGEYGVVFQDSRIRRMVFRPGDTTTAFEFDVVTEDKGLLAPYSIVRTGERVFFLSQQGFHQITGTGYPEPFGKEKFDRTFFNDYDKASLQLIIAAADPEGSRIYIGYKSGAGTTGLFDKIIIYDYVLQRGAVIVNQAGEFMAPIGSPGLTLENLDTISPSIDALSFSLDDVALSAIPKMAFFDSTHALGFFTGANLEATVDTSEQAIDGRRVRVRGARPLTDATNCFVSVGARENMQSAVAYSGEQAVDASGRCPANVSTRLARARVRIPAAATWTFASGVEPDFVREGRR
jgi:hypothetical protein